MIFHKKNAAIRFVSVLLVMLSLMMLFSACTDNQKNTEITTLDDIKELELTIATSADLASDIPFDEICPNAEIIYLEDVDCFAALNSGKADACIISKESGTYAIKNGSVTNAMLLDDPIKNYDVSFALCSETPIDNYESRVNSAIKQLMDDGTLDQMEQRWFEDGDEQMPQITMPENPEYTLKIVTYGQEALHSYYKDGVLAGFDIELAERVASIMGCDIEWYTASFEGMLAGVATGKYDMIASNLFVTDERDESIIYSDAYRHSSVNMLIHYEASGKNELVTSLSQIDESYVFGSVTGSAMTDIIKKYYPNAKVVEYNTLHDELLALSSGKFDAILYDKPLLAYAANQYSNLYLLDELLVNEDYYFLMQKNEWGEQLSAEFNEWIAPLRADGTLDEMQKYWEECDTPEGRVINYQDLPDINGTLKTITPSNGRPCEYVYNGQFAGYTIELFTMFCRDKGYALSVEQAPLASIVAGLSSGKYDAALAQFSYTEERAENVLYTDSVYSGGLAIMLRNPDNTESVSLLDTLTDGFEKTFIREGRWKMILSGLGVTLIITFGGFLLANIFGALFCAMAMSHIKMLNIVSDVYSKIMQGTPIVVILMMLYYVILGSTKLSGITVSIIGFGLSEGAVVAQIFQGAVKSVEKGQTEAALALGFTKFRTFVGIVLPQAIRTALPGYFSQLISLMKGTSIVGYIAVVDMTKASDLIRSSTYEAFFPLISIAVIYFIIAVILLSVMKKIVHALEPKRINKDKESV